MRTVSPCGESHEAYVMKILPDSGMPMRENTIQMIPLRTCALSIITSNLLKHRQLAWEMTLREIRDRYAGQVFGSMWAIGHPLFLMAIYLVIFNFVFPGRVGGTYEMPRNLTTYILSGLVPWLTFQDVLSRSPTSISSNANLVKQVVFPVEILPIRTVLSTMPNLFIGILILAGYILFKEHSLPWTFLLFPVLVFIQILAMTGVAYLFATVGVYFRDLKDIVTVFNAANLFMMPVLFTPGVLPDYIESAFYLNPFSYMVWCYQDIFYYGRFEHPAAWFVFTTGSLALLSASAKLFLKTRSMLGNVL